MEFSGEADDYAPQFESCAWVKDDEIEEAAVQSPHWGKVNEIHHQMPSRSSEVKRELDGSRSHATQRGKEAEQLFAELASKEWKVHETSLHEDKVGHIDFYLQQESVQIPLDVKALRCITRKRGLQNKYVWVELHKTGFLFGGHSTCIALQYSPQKFLLVNKKALQKLVRESFIEKAPVRWNNQAYHRAFQREDTNEWIGFLELLGVAKTCAVGVVNNK
jgi:hypothetical protein